MNYKVICYYLGQILRTISIAMALPILVGLIYGEFVHILPLIVAFALYFGIGALLIYSFKSKDHKLRSKEGLVIVGLSWVAISVIGALPFVIDGCIPNYIDALFETVSGFTTTGATAIPDLSVIPHCMLFWRSFTHWLGGMGILVFILAIMPSTDGSTFHLFKFESPGPQVGKIASKVRHTATILYLIYFVLTFAEMLFLLIGGVDPFNSVLIAMSTAGTGGFAATGASIAEFNSLYVEIVVMVFMFIFSLNFNLYYLVVLKHFKIALTDREFLFFSGYVFIAMATVTINLLGYYGSFGEALRYSSFAVLSLTSSTGFATADFAAWPQFSQSVLMLCMLFGACAGSTGGGMKASRILILGKAAYTSLLQVLRPRSVQVVKLNGKMLKEEEVNGVIRYFLIYIIILLLATLIISSQGLPFVETFTSALSCLNNDGPYFANAFAGYENFAWWNKIVLMILMLVGRLEIYPMLLLFIPKTWSKSY